MELGKSRVNVTVGNDACCAWADWLAAASTRASTRCSCLRKHPHLEVFIPEDYAKTQESLPLSTSFADRALEVQGCRRVEMADGDRQRVRRIC